MSSEEATFCVELAGRGVLIASWLAAVCRTELFCFREFISWLRFGKVPLFYIEGILLKMDFVLEINNVNSPNDGSNPRHDILEVNNYLINGLGNSSIDKWFTGPVPQFQAADLGILENWRGSLAEVLEKARTVASEPSEMIWQIVRPVSVVIAGKVMIETLLCRIYHEKI